MGGSIDIARKALRELWVAPHAYARVAEVVRDLFPSADHGIAYDWSQDGQVGECGHTFAPGGVGWHAFGSIPTKLPGFKQYQLSGADPFANRAVATGELFRGRDAELERARAELWSRVGHQHYQLRIALFERGRLSALVAVLKGRGGSDFCCDEARRLDAVAQDIRDALEAARAIGPIPGSSTTLGRVLDAFEHPAFLTTQSGTIVYANVAARGCHPRRPEWLDAVIGNSAKHVHLASVTRLDHEGRSLFLVLPRDSVNGRPQVQLPPALARVADLACHGLSDKEIAAALSMPLATVRTYMRRAYATLGVRNRVMLRAAWESRPRPVK